MSKLNARGKAPSVRSVAASRNVELAVSANGNLQFKKEPLQMLYEVVVQAMLGRDGQLKTSDQLVKTLKENVAIAVEMGAYDFVANLAIHARTEMNVRTIPIVLVVEFAKALSNKRQRYLDGIKKLENNRTKLSKSSTKSMRVATLREAANEHNYENMRQLVCDVIQRADQITDMYAYALSVFGSKNNIPMAIKRGVADAFNKFGEYAFAKYNRDGAVKFRDVLRIVHPRAVSIKQGEIFEKIMKDTLSVPYTWETELSMNGQLPVEERKSTAALWTELVKSGKMGYMALLRNLRNISQAGVAPDVVREHVCNVIADPARVAKSKQLPYDFKEAYNIIKAYDGKMATAVSKAMDLSVSNMPQLGNRVWVIIDYSGSMGQMGHETSAYEGATFLAAALLKANSDADCLAVTAFGSSAKMINGIDTNGSLVSIQKQLDEHRKGSIAGSTEFGAALALYKTLPFVPDTIVVLTDGEVNRFPYTALRSVGTGKDVVKLVVNMSAAVSTPLTSSDGWFTLAGWSPAMFKWVPAIRNKETVVDQLSVPYKGIPRKEAVVEE